MRTLTNHPEYKLGTLEDLPDTAESISCMSDGLFQAISYNQKPISFQLVNLFAKYREQYSSQTQVSQLDDQQNLHAQRQQRDSASFQTESLHSYLI